MKNNNIIVYFEVTLKEELGFSMFSDRQLMKHPVHEHYLRKVDKILIEYDYRPCSNLDQKALLIDISKGLKRKYNADSVIFLGTKIQELKLNSVQK